MRKKTWKRVSPYIWILPSCVLMAIFIVVPIFYVFRMAFSRVTKAGLIKELSGFGNFARVFATPAFGTVLWNTVVWTVAVVGISTVLGFILALILNNKFRGRKIVRRNRDDLRKR
ncbi:MAG: sugar ABC transporter permease [Lachnospiraceae bacterium]|nr:sugar ABC transporter permease [Lachnospiraceae bacterium]